MNLRKLHSISIHNKILIPFVFFTTFLAGLLLIFGSNTIFIYMERMLRSAYTSGQFSDLQTELLQLKQRVFWVGLLISGGLVLFLMLVFSLIIGVITRYIRRFKAVAQKVSQGDFSQRIEVTSDDEIGQLASIFNEMTSNLQISTQSVIQEKNRSEAIIEEMPAGVLVTDLQGDILMLNRTVRAIFGVRETEVMGYPVARMVPHEDVVSQIDTVVQAEGGTEETEWAHEISSGGRKRFKVRSSLVRKALGEKLGVVTVFQDITLEKELIELREGFLRTITHELRTPLTSIIGFIELARGGSGLDDRQKKYLTVSLECAINLKTMINDILDLSKLEAGQVELKRAPLNIYDLSEDVIESLVPVLKDKGLTIKNLISPQGSVVYGDKEKLRRILVNILSNAIKFTHEGGIVFSSQTQGSDLIVRIKDTGIGMDVEGQKVIFEKFRQLDYSSKRMYEGIGLGLSIVKELVELHDGKVWAESRPGQGSEFFVQLPTVPPAEKTAS